MAKPNDTDAKTPGDKPDAPALNFIQEIIEEHNKTGRFGGKVHTRFPPAVKTPIRISCKTPALKLL